MKYFKYNKMGKVQALADKRLLESLDVLESKKIIRNRRMQLLISVFGFIIFLALFGFLIYLITLIPEPASIPLIILYAIGCFILGIIALAFSGIIIGVIFTRLMEKFHYDYPNKIKIFISESCQLLRDYYGLKEDYLLTKCFDSTNSNFINHDICIFRYNDEIRITTDIVNGFLNYNRDLGCYSIKNDEIKFYKETYNNKRVTVIEFKKEKFIVGIKAYQYILKLMVFKIYKCFHKSILLDNKFIYFKNRKNILKFNYEEIEKIEVSIPKYSLPLGSGQDNVCTFKLTKLDSQKYSFDIVLEIYEHKDILRLLQEKNFQVIVNYYDNKNSGSD